MTDRLVTVRGGSVFAVAVLVLLMLASACSPVYRMHGYVPSDEELALVEVGRDTRDTVAVSIGRPSAAGLLNDVGWYYVQSRWRNVGGRPPIEENRQVVAITFSDDGVVENIERFGLEKGRVIAISRRITETNVKGASFLRQLFGNVGGVNAGGLIQ